MNKKNRFRNTETAFKQYELQKSNAVKRIQIVKCNL